MGGWKTDFVLGEQHLSPQPNPAGLRPSGNSLPADLHATDMHTAGHAVRLIATAWLEPETTYRPTWLLVFLQL